LLRFTRAEGIPLNAAQLVTKARTIVRGRLVGVAEGRTIDFATGASNPINTAVFQVEVTRVLKGAPTPDVYLEFIRGGIPVASIASVLPDGLDLLVFLSKADGWVAPTYRIDGEGKGHPPGTILETYLTQEGWVIDAAGGIQHPLADDPSARIFDESRIGSLDALEGEVARILAMP
jgi:hypothetical protein